MSAKSLFKDIFNNNEVNNLLHFDLKSKSKHVIGGLIQKSRNLL